MPDATNRTERYRAVVDAAYTAGTRYHPQPPFTGDWRATKAEAEGDAATYLKGVPGEVTQVSVDIVLRRMFVAPGEGGTFCSWGGDRA